MENHLPYLERCLALAREAAQAGESAVGCVIVKDGLIIGEGTEQSRRLKDVTRHAEVVAVLDAVHRYGSCEGAVLYSNMEPCMLCAYVIRHYKIAAVVYSNYCGELGGTELLKREGLKSWGKEPEVVYLSLP
ncbi:nucleoside deaminase [Chitinophaga sancti]|uniref:Deaminase n=1 Tax=Chitinophaga sancti TaxID=1004 RepID=A0A1K1MVP1_9BACT|nr:deaminase [Chitinophaga sancti]WQD63028.1 deaminase [Chitinophaga sancti]WQG91347.1 deaminase [Chitinophaga sancti]SFW27175.1 Cytidine and deoxycytidylate deaminase zinc-binding region [Chitinophaga sancti]